VASLLIPSDSDPEGATASKVSTSRRLIGTPGHGDRLSKLAAGRMSFDRPVAYFCALASTIPIGTSQYLRLSLVLLVPMIPVILSQWLRSKRAVGLAALVLLSALSGLLLASANAGSGRTWDSWTATSQIAQVLALIFSVSGTLWCCSILGFNRFLVVWSIGTALCSPLTADRFFDNPWKFGLALPVSLILLYMASKFSARVVTFVFLALMGLSVLLSFRSWLLVLGAALLIHLFSALRTKNQQRNAIQRDSVRKVALVTLLVLGISVGGNIFSDLALKGQLGEYAQSRTQQSLEVSGNPFIGSRAEWGGALALMQSEPFGLGAGIGPSGNDWAIAIEHLTLPDELKEKSNVASSFRSGRIEFHSTFWNFWSYFGFAGIGLVIYLIVILMKAILTLSSERHPNHDMPTAVVAVLLVGVIWDILFSPNNSWTLGVAVAAALQVFARPRHFTATNLSRNIKAMVQKA
jgi:hypothetical protein